MRRATVLLIVLGAMGILAAPVAATQHNSTPTNKNDCEAQGGTWINDSGEKYCLFVQPGGGELTVTVDSGDGDDWDIATDVWTEADIRETEDDDDEFLVVFEYGEKQRGNIGARGTRATRDDVETCRVEGARNLLSERQCAWARGLVDSDREVSRLRIMLVDNEDR